MSWGVPWPKGKVQKSDTLVLKTADGKAIPAQIWPMAYWPDGSIMWSGHSIAATPDMAGPLQIAVGAAAESAVKIACTQDGQAITIDTGAIRVRVPKQGSNLIESISIGDRKIAQDGKLVCQLEDRSNFETARTIRQEEFVSRIKTVTLEQPGPVRAVVKIEGDHKSTSSDRAWLPFVVRPLLQRRPGLDPDRPLIRLRQRRPEGLHQGPGDLVLRADARRSHQPPRAFRRRRRNVGRAGGADRRAGASITAGKGARSSPPGGRQADSQHGAVCPGAEQQYIRDIAHWDDYKLTQANANGFVIEKRTQAKSSWLHVTEGRRALGLAFLGDVTRRDRGGREEVLAEEPGGARDSRRDHVHGRTAGLALVARRAGDGHAPLRRHRARPGHGL